MFGTKASDRPPATAHEIDPESQARSDLPTAVAHPYNDSRPPIIVSQPQQHRAMPGTMFGGGGGGFMGPRGPAGAEYVPSAYTCPALLGFCCFWPLGLFALFTSCAVNSKKAKGDLDGAAKFSRITKILALLSIFLGVAIVVITLGSYYGTGSNNNNTYRSGYRRYPYGGGYEQAPAAGGN